MKKIKDGLLIILEGGEGVGKTTNALKIVERLKKEDYDAIYLREPGGNKVAEDIRNLVLYNEMDCTTEFLLFCAARCENIKTNVIPTLADGKIIIMDRFTPTTYVYQGVINGTQFHHIDMLNDIISVYDIKNIYQFILLCDAEVAHERAKMDGHERNKNDKKSIDFYRRVNDTYSELADMFKSSTYSDTVIDTTTLSENDVYRQLLYRVKDIINMHEH